MICVAIARSNNGHYFIFEVCWSQKPAGDTTQSSLQQTGGYFRS